MPEPSSDENKEQVTRLLQRVSGDDPQSSEKLLPLVYSELRRLAGANLRREAPGQTLDGTALVHEAYLRLVGENDPGWNGRGHFFGAAARAMRRILVERARRLGREKHGGGRRPLDIDQFDVPHPRPEEDVLAVNEALARLEQQDERKGRILELRYYGGLSAEETAAAIGVSLATLERDWRFIKAWLRTELGEEAED